MSAGRPISWPPLEAGNFASIDRNSAGIWHRGNIVPSAATDCEIIHRKLINIRFWNIRFVFIDEVSEKCQLHQRGSMRGIEAEAVKWSWAKAKMHVKSESKQLFSRLYTRTFSGSRNVISCRKFSQSHSLHRRGDFDRGETLNFLFQVKTFSSELIKVYSWESLWIGVTRMCSLARLWMYGMTTEGNVDDVRDGPIKASLFEERAIHRETADAESKWRKGWTAGARDWNSPTDESSTARAVKGDCKYHIDRLLPPPQGVRRLCSHINSNITAFSTPTLFATRSYANVDCVWKAHVDTAKKSWPTSKDTRDILHNIYIYRSRVQIDIWIHSAYRFRLQIGTTWKMEESNKNGERRRLMTSGRYKIQFHP